MNTKTEKAKPSLSDLLNETLEKLEKAKTSLAALAAASAKAKTKVSDLKAKADNLKLKKQKEQMTAMGVSDLSALLDFAKSHGFKSQNAPLRSAPVSAAAPVPVQAKPAAPAR